MEWFKRASAMAFCGGIVAIFIAGKISGFVLGFLVTLPVACLAMAFAPIPPEDL